MRGIVFDGNDLIVTDDLEVRPPGPGEVQVRLLASGVCHSDVNVIERGGAHGLPIVLGHEGAGVVEQVGEGVRSVKAGDAVAVTCQTPCGECRACLGERYTECPGVFGDGFAPFTWQGQTVHGFANSASFARMTTVKEMQLHQAAGIPPAAAALVGCAVSTGYGAARNQAGVRKGDTVAVFGIGGIGINALQTARVLGAARIVAVDVNPAKEEIARRFGAAAFVAGPRDTTSEALAALVQEAADGPIDASIECSGAPAAIDAAIACLGRGGRAAMVGIPPEGTNASVPVNLLLRQGLRVVGGLNGTSDPFRDMPEIMRLVRAGEFDLESQVTRVYPLAEVKAAIAAMAAGEVVRAVLDHTK